VPIGYVDATNRCSLRSYIVSVSREEIRALRLVKTDDEISAIQSVYARGHNLGVRSLSVLFETTPHALAALLPPPLEPAPEPLGLALVQETGNSTTVGPFDHAALFLRASYQETIGYYCVSMPTSRAVAAIFGREMYGFPRKTAKIIFGRQDEYVWGSAERHEVRFLSMRGRLDSPAPTGRQTQTFFTFKASLRCDGSGFESAPRLVEVIEEMNLSHAEAGRGELIFRDSAHDPVGDIPVAQVGSASYMEGQTYTTARVLAEVDPDAFLPYAFCGVDSTDLVAEGTLMHAQAARRTNEGRGRWRESQSSA
jgi:acetoacetate decarboxylase